MCTFESCYALNLQNGWLFSWTEKMQGYGPIETLCKKLRCNDYKNATIHKEITGKSQ